MGSYIDSGFDENLIRHNFSGTEETVSDSTDVGELITGDAIPATDVEGELIMAGVIDSDLRVITDIINENLNTASAEILGQFVFTGSGAIAIMTDDNNGTWLSPAGILAKKGGVDKFALTDEGDAIFGGSLVAADGTLGALTIASGGNIKMGKTAFTDDTHPGFFLGDDGGSAKFKMGSSASKFFSYDGADFSMVGGTIQTALTGYRVKLSSSGLQFFSSDSLKGSIGADASGSVVYTSADNHYFRDGSKELGRFDGNGILLPTSAKIYFSSGRYIQGEAAELKFSGDLRPEDDHGNSCGTASRRWDYIRGRYFVGDTLSLSGDIGCDYITCDEVICSKITQNGYSGVSGEFYDRDSNKIRVIKGLIVDLDY